MDRDCELNDTIPTEVDTSEVLELGQDTSRDDKSFRTITASIALKFKGSSLVIVAYYVGSDNYIGKVSPYAFIFQDLPMIIENVVHHL